MTLGAGIAIGTSVGSLTLGAVAVIRTLISAKAAKTEPHPITTGLANSIIKILEILQEIKAEISPHFPVIRSKLEGTHETVKEIDFVVKRNGDKIEGIEDKVDAVDKTTSEIRITQKSIDKRIK